MLRRQVELDKFAMTDRLPGFFEGTEMPTAGWWDTLWPNPAGVLQAVGLKQGMDAVDLCCGDGWFTLQIAKVARHVVAIDIDRNFLDVAWDRPPAGASRTQDIEARRTFCGRQLASATAR